MEETKTTMDYFYSLGRNEKGLCVEVSGRGQGRLLAPLYRKLGDENNKVIIEDERGKPHKD